MKDVKCAVEKFKNLLSSSKRREKKVEYLDELEQRIMQAWDKKRKKCRTDPFAADRELFSKLVKSCGSSSEYDRQVISAFIFLISTHHLRHKRGHEISDLAEDMLAHLAGRLKFWDHLQ